MKIWLGLWLVAVAAGATVDLTRATVVLPERATPRERKAAAMLAEEVEKRTLVHWDVASASSGPAIRIVRATGGPAEGFAIRTLADGVEIAGNDERGVLFGAGYLLRKMRLERGWVTVDSALAIRTAPKVTLRGHQLGYRPKTNSYDGWTVAMWEQYIRDLAVFGANAAELIPPRSDDDKDSPHFPLPPMRMMKEVSRLLDEYGLDVWIWYPALDKDYSDPKTVDAAVKEWAEVFRQLPRVDAVFVPGGDPGDTPPGYLMALLEKQTASLHQYHPKAQMWVSPQGFNRAWMDEFLGILRGRQPEWLTGVVFGPQQIMSLKALREAVPKRYPIRHYPDITHSLRAQYPVPDWDTAFAMTEGREVINPRPMDEASIFAATARDTIGFIAYSEGCNDDVNKAVWSGLGWDPATPVIETLRDFARYFISERWTEQFAQGLLDLERNWRGPLATNEDVERTLENFRAMERAATPPMRANWRFQQALYRAYYDAYTRRRLLAETAAEDHAMERLRGARTNGALKSMDEAEAELDRAVRERPAADLRARCFELAEALFQSIRMQLSVERYQAIGVERGATLDTIDRPLNSRDWLKERFAAARRLADETARLKAIDEIVNWTDPGPGGFYDDLGNLTRQPHLVRASAYADDPAFERSPLVGFQYRAAYRKSWWDHAEALHEAPLSMHYEGLDRGARYKLRVVYAGDNTRAKIRLTAGGVEVHGWMEKPRPVAPVEFEIPASATAGGVLDLEWRREPGLGGSGRACQVAEVWLVRK